MYTAVGMQTCAITTENSMAVLKKIKNRITIWSSSLTSGYMSKRTESRISKKYLYIHANNSITYKSQEVEATQILLNRWMDKENMV